jgi:hypothetical protein
MESPVCGPQNEEMKEGRKRKATIKFDPSLSLPSLPANFLLVTRSEVPIQTFQRPKTLALAIL